MGTRGTLQTRKKEHKKLAWRLKVIKLTPMKTLSQFIAQFGLSPKKRGDFVIIPLYSLPNGSNRELFQLSDYRVSSCSGGAYWMGAKS